MKKLIAVTGFLVLTFLAVNTAQAQTDPPPATDPATAPPPTTDPATTTTDQSTIAAPDSTMAVATDSTGAVIPPDSLTFPIEKSSSRLRTYSGKHRGNNVIYNPNKN